MPVQEDGNILYTSSGKQYYAELEHYIPRVWAKARARKMDQITKGRQRGCGGRWRLSRKMVNSIKWLGMIKEGKSGKWQPMDLVTERQSGKFSSLHVAPCFLLSFCTTSASSPFDHSSPQTQPVWSKDGVLTFQHSWQHNHSYQPQLPGPQVNSGLRDSLGQGESLLVSWEYS